MKRSMTQVLLVDAPWGHGGPVLTEVPLVASKLFAAGIPFRIQVVGQVGRARLMVPKADKERAFSIHNTLTNLPGEERFRKVGFTTHNRYPLDDVRDGIFSYVYDTTGLIPIITDSGEDFIEFSAL